MCAFFCCFAGCEKDPAEIGDENTPDSIDVKVRNGRLYFDSVESFQAEYNKVKDKEENDMYSSISKHYNDEFVPLRPIITESNQVEIARFNDMAYKNYLEDYKEYAKSFESSISQDLRIPEPEETLPDLIPDGTIADHYDDIEDIMGDDAMSSYLNSNAEIQISDEIYKFTDAGLFISKDYGEIYVMKTLKKFRNNDDKVSKTFDWGVGVSITLNERNDYSLREANFGTYLPQQPKDLSVRMYGVAKTGGKWHGSLLEF